MAASLQIARGVVDVWAAPGAGRNDDRLTQALLGWPAEILEERAGWARVRLPDYEGWVERAALAAPAAALGCDSLLVTAPGAPLYAGTTDAAPTQEVFLGTRLPVVEAAAPALPIVGAALLLPPRIAVALPGGRSAWIDAAAGECLACGLPPPARPPAHAVAVARQLLGTPYLWGGGTYRGIDCSALVQRAYGLGGHTLPRDADQQWGALPTAVARDAQREGDLLFFAREGEVVHVALAIDGVRFIHALGAPPLGVCIQSLEPTEPGFNARLAGIYLGTRRVVV